MGLPVKVKFRANLGPLQNYRLELQYIYFLNKSLFSFHKKMNYEAVQIDDIFNHTIFLGEIAKDVHIFSFFTKFWHKISFQKFLVILSTC